MMTTFRLEGASWRDRQVQLTRLSHLVSANNIRALHADPADAWWSTYQYSVACAALGVKSEPTNADEQPVIQTKYNTWENELWVVLDALTYLLDECEEAEDDDA